MYCWAAGSVAADRPSKHDALQGSSERLLLARRYVRGACDHFRGHVSAPDCDHGKPQNQMCPALVDHAAGKHRGWQAAKHRSARLVAEGLCMHGSELISCITVGRSLSASRHFLIVDDSKGNVGRMVGRQEIKTDIVEWLSLPAGGRLDKKSHGAGLGKSYTVRRSLLSAHRANADQQRDAQPDESTGKAFSKVGAVERECHLLVRIISGSL